MKRDPHSILRLPCFHHDLNVRSAREAEEPAVMATAMVVVMVSMTVAASIMITVWQGLTTVMIATIMTKVPGAVQMQLEAPLVEAVTAAGVPAASGTV